MTCCTLRIRVFIQERMIYLSSGCFKRKKVIVITVILSVVLLLSVMLILLNSVFICIDPSTATIDRQVVENAVNELKSTLTEKEYEMMLTIGRDWEENTDGSKYLGNSNTNLKVENGKMAEIDLHRCGFQVPMSMIISGEEVGVKYVRNILEPDTDNPYHEKAEYGICYIYGNDPYKFADPDTIYASVPYFAKNINYLEKVYDDLYIYVIYADPLA